MRACQHFLIHLGVLDSSGKSLVHEGNQLELFRARQIGCHWLVACRSSIEVTEKESYKRLDAHTQEVVIAMLDEEISRSRQQIREEWWDKLANHEKIALEDVPLWLTEEWQ